MLKKGQPVPDSQTTELQSRARAVMKFVQFLLKNSSVTGIPKQVERFSKFSPSPLSMKQFLDFGKYFRLGLKKIKIKKDDMP